MFSLISCTNYDTNTKNINKLEEIDIYFLDDKAEYLISAKEMLEPDAKKIVEYLINEPRDCPFPEGTKLLSLKIKDKKAYVNLNKAFDEGVTSDLIHLHVEKKQENWQIQKLIKK